MVFVAVATSLGQQTPKPLKDFSNTGYTDDFVKKYSLNTKHIKTDADKTFERKWSALLRETANYLQQYVYDYDYKEVDKRVNQLRNDVKDYSAFLSYDCRTDFEEKLKQANYKIKETLQTKRL